MPATNRKQEVNLYHSENPLLQMHHQHLHCRNSSSRGDGKLQEPAELQARETDTHVSRRLQNKRTRFITWLYRLRKWLLVR